MPYQPKTKDVSTQTDEQDVKRAVCKVKPMFVPGKGLGRGNPLHVQAELHRQ